MTAEREAGAPTPREREVEELVAAYLLDKEEGRAPPLDEFLARHPRHAEDLALLLGDGLLQPARRMPAATGPAVGGSVGPYELLEHVATGGGGSVFRARHREEGHEAALKVLHVPAVDTELEVLQGEARVLRELDVVNVIPVYDVGRQDGRAWIAMKWIEGTTLADLVENVRDPSHPLHAWAERARLVARIASALGAAHQRGIFHRDVKPSNVMVDRLCEPALIDFGISRAAGRTDARDDDSSSSPGTPRYVAPELLAGEPFTARSEVYALGLCLYELAVGSPAIVQTDRRTLFDQIRRGRLPPPRSVNPAVPEGLAAIVLRATDHDPARRYAGMQDLAADLLRFARGDAPETRTLRHARPVRRLWIRHRRVLVPAGSAVAVVLLAAMFLVVRTLLEDARLARLEERLGPWVWAPREVLPSDHSALLDAARELGQASADQPERRLRAAWIPYLAGDYEQALAVLGVPGPDDSRAARLFRSYLRLLVEALDEGDAEGERAVVVLPGLEDDPRLFPDRVEMIDLEPVEVKPGESEEGVEVVSPGAEAEARRRRLHPPRPRQVEELLAVLEGGPASPAEAFLEGHLRWMALPGDLDADDAAAPCRAIGRAAAAAVRGGIDWARWMRAAVAVRYGDPAGARGDLDVLMTLHPDVGPVPYLRAVVEHRCDGPLASLLFERAARLLEADGRALGQLYGWWATHELAAERGAAARRVIDRWQQAVRPPAWSDRFFPCILRAGAAELEGEPPLALEHLDRALQVRPRAALPLRLAAGVHERLLGDAERALELRERARGQIQQWPVGIEAYLVSRFFGLRPDSHVTRLTTRYNRPR